MGFKFRTPQAGIVGGHVQAAANVFSSSADGAFAGVFAAVFVVGSDSDQGGNLLSAELSQFRQFRQQHVGRSLCDAGDASQQLRHFFPVIVTVDERFELLIDGFDLLLESVQELSDTGFDDVCLSGVASIFFGGLHFDELTSSEAEKLDLLLFFRGESDQSRLCEFAEADEELGIDAIGFGFVAESACEFPHSFGIHDGDHVLVFDEKANEPFLISAGGFDNGEALSCGWHLGEEFLQVLWSVLDGVRLLVFVQTDFESLLGDINADDVGVRRVHQNVPVLLMRTRSPVRGAVPAAVRAIGKRPTTIPLCDGLGVPMHNRSVAGHTDLLCFATLHRADQCGRNIPFQQGLI